MKRIFNTMTWILMAGTFVLLAHTFWINVENARRIDEIKQEIQASEEKCTVPERSIFDNIKKILND